MLTSPDNTKSPLGGLIPPKSIAEPIKIAFSCNIERGIPIFPECFTGLVVRDDSIVSHIATKLTDRQREELCPSPEKPFSLEQCCAILQSRLTLLYLWEYDRDASLSLTEIYGTADLVKKHKTLEIECDA